MTGSDRRLAAIMFTDMVGFSALTQRNEALALELLEEHFTLLRPLIPQHNGHEVKTIGDSFMVEFASPLQALRCAIAMQKALSARNTHAQPDRQIAIRVGIHLGDVEHRAGDVFGDGVNIAARLEPLAEPGGICLSQQIYDHVHNKLDVPLVSVGRPEMKNIRTPIEVYRVVLPWRRDEQTAASTVPGPSPQPAAPDRRSIAVLPLANLSPDPENEYFSDGLTEDILTQLSKIQRLKVISRTSVMQYKKTSKNLKEIGRELGVATILEGSVRKAANKVRISVQLIDAGTDEHLWAETYDRELADIFAIQSDVARQITDALKAQVSADERARIEHRPTGSLEAYQTHLKGLFLWNQRTEAGVKAAMEHFRRAIALDPGYAPAYVGLADAYIVLGNFGKYRPRDIYPPAEAAARQALDLDDTLGEAHTSLGQVKYNYSWDWQGAEDAYRRAIELRPSYATAHHWYALFLSTIGRYDDALSEILRAKDLDPLSAAIAANVGAVLFVARRYDEALAEIRKAVAATPEFRTVHWYLGWVLLMKEAYADALPPLLRAGAQSSEGDVLSRALLGFAYAKLGNRDSALEIAGALADQYRSAYASPVWIAFLHLGLGDRGEALRWLARACDDRDGWLRLIKAPFFDELHGTPEFAQVLTTVGLEAPHPAG
jgi:TolB-like protein/class 3 adenylate cyclase/Tfp pilus assembly protein PilF